MSQMGPLESNRCNGKNQAQLIENFKPWMRILIQSSQTQIHLDVGWIQYNEKVVTILLTK